VSDGQAILRIKGGTPGAHRVCASVRGVRFAMNSRIIMVTGSCSRSAFLKRDRLG
jgi:hypothetical protein